LDLPRRWAVEREPARKHEACESRYGSSRRESSVGRLQGRERHETRPQSVGASRRTAGSARGSCVPRARPEPSRGARTLRTALVGVWRPSPFLLRLHGRGGWNGAPDVDSAHGSKNSTRGDPELGRHAVVAQATIARPGRGQPRRSPALKGTRTPREDLPGLRFRESGRTRKTPRPSRTARGERWKPARRYSVGNTNL
jgi:hypothetical protein